MNTYTDPMDTVPEAPNFNPTRWQDLVVWNEGEIVGSLAGFCDENDDALAGIVLSAAGQISEWPYFFVAADGEDPDWDTPRGAVDWAGFAEALAEALAEATED